MDDDVSATRFIVERVSSVEWALRDRGRMPDGPGDVIAKLHEVDGQIRVRWFVEVPLPLRYAIVEDVVDDVARWTARSSRSTRPIPIPHYAPPPSSRV